MTRRAKIVVHPRFTVGNVSPNLYGIFLESIGRAVYGGLYNPSHPCADAEGFRTDVLALMRELGVSCVRYPGGNAVSFLRWEDTVGPRESRPTRLNLAFHQVEPNDFGLDEFMHWCGKIGAEPMMTLNLGTRGIPEALDFVEYCNHPGGTTLSDLRRSHGAEAPYGIKTWFLGNEMSGRWQMPGREMQDYAYVARESAKMVRAIAPESNIVLCGPCGHFDLCDGRDWLYHTLSPAVQHVDQVSIHSYLRNHITPQAFSAELEEVDDYFTGVIRGCDYISLRNWTPGKVKVSVDEWGVFHGLGTELRDHGTWDKERQLIEENYTVTDALLAGGMLVNLLSHADAIRTACYSEAVNAIAPICADNDGAAWRRAIFYPIALTARHGRGTVLQQAVVSDSFKASDEDREIPGYHGVTLVNQEKGELVVLCLNRFMCDQLELSLDAEGLRLASVVENLTIHNEDLQAVNTQFCAPIVPVPGNKVELKEGQLNVILPPASWNLIRVKLS